VPRFTATPSTWRVLAALTAQVAAELPAVAVVRRRLRLLLEPSRVREPEKPELSPERRTWVLVPEAVLR